MVQSEHNMDNRRVKNLFINKGLQFRFIMTSLVYMFLVMAVTLAMVVVPDLYTMFSSQDLAAQHQAAQNYLILATRIVPSAFFLFFLMFVHQLFMTHKIFGPLVNFTNTFKKIGDGDLSRKVMLRKGDYLKGECEVINGMIEGLSLRFQEIAQEHVRVIQVLETTLPALADGPAKNDLENLIHDLKNRSADMAGFPVSDDHADER